MTRFPSVGILDELFRDAEDRRELRELQAGGIARGWRGFRIRRNRRALDET